MEIIDFPDTSQDNTGSGDGGPERVTTPGSDVFATEVPDYRLAFESPPPAVDPQLEWLFTPFAFQPDFKYRPLESESHIRVLMVLPAQPGDKPECELILVDLAAKSLGWKSQQKNQYSALSYYWGKGEARSEIQIRHSSDDRRQTYRFFVKSNLFAALLQFRRTDFPVNLWIDAICIDQNNNTEKANQISKMQEIYNSATNVCIWLGPAISTSDIAFPFIKDVLNLDGFDTLIRDESNRHKWLALAQLMQNKWFTRRWVIQEVSLARNATVHCGTQAVHGSDFADAVALFVSRIDQINQLFPPHLPVIPDRVRVLGANVLVNISNCLFRKSPAGKILERLRTMETLVSTLLPFEATDPKDTIYAILALAKDEPGQKIEPDYQKTLAEVCVDFIRYCVESSGSLDIICRHWAPVENDSEREMFKEKAKVPSWIPSISGSAFGAPEDSLNGRVNGDSLVGVPGRHNYNATLGLPPADVRFDLFAEVNISATVQKKFQGAMRVKGIRLNTITELGPRAAEGYIFRECLEMGGISTDHKQAPTRVPDELWRTLVADRAPDGSNPPSWYHRACLYCLAKRTTAGDINTSALIKSRESPQMMVEFLKRVQSTIWNRKFFVASHNVRRAQYLDKRLFGLAPSKARVGDMIVILYGCSVPVLLRPHSDALPSPPPPPLGSKRKRPPSEPLETPPIEMYFEFIGECYVYGMMDGEARSLKEQSENILEDEFVVR